MKQTTKSLRKLATKALSDANIPVWSTFTDTKSFADESDTRYVGYIIIGSIQEAYDAVKVAFDNAGVDSSANIRMLHDKIKFTAEIV
jgi:hypothetical protein